MAQKKTGVVLLNMGGPDSFAAIKPFLRNLFRDKDIVRFPFWQSGFAMLISAIAAPKSRKRYELIGGYSPLKEITEKQAKALSGKLENRNISNVTRVAMRYWHPFTGEALKDLREEGLTELVALSLYPQFSNATTGSSFRELYRVMEDLDYRPKTLRIDSWHDDPGYIELLAAMIDAEGEHEKLLFSAHSLPVSMLEAGDPYKEQIEATAAKTAEKLGADYILSYQSQADRGRWLGPSTGETLEELGKKGVKSVLVVPLGFVSDNIETLWEIDIYLRNIAAEAGIEVFKQLPLFNDDPRFISVLAGLAERKIKEFDR